MPRIKDDDMAMSHLVGVRRFDPAPYADLMSVLFAGGGMMT